MREILFRGKKLSDHTWIEGTNIIQKSICGEQVIYLGPVPEISGQWARILSTSLGQFTGIKLADGTKLFKGDILCDVLGDVAQVVFDNGSFGFIYNKPYADFIPFYGKFRQYANDGTAINFDFKLIGNIHDNPELMEVAK